MLPIVLDPGKLAIGLAGAGEGLARRHALLAGAGIVPRPVPADAAPDDLCGLSVLFIAGLSPDDSEALAGRARAAGILVNAEDLPAACDFHVPAAIRRGDLLLTVSTGGKAPGLARLLREWLDTRLGPEWGARLRAVEDERTRWRAAGLSMSEVAGRTRAYVAEKGWLS